uniref:RHS repeat domain-containing protein n=1 Tax=Cupriavidus laharis TaxID=151654 RepID=UPI001CC6D928
MTASIHGTHYDALGQIVGVVGPFDLVTRYTYNAAHRLIQILDKIAIADEIGNG